MDTIERQHIHTHACAHTDLTFRFLCNTVLYSTGLSLPDAATTEHHFCFGQAASSFLEPSVIALCSSLGVYWTPSDLGGSPSGAISFLPLHTVHKQYETYTHYLYKTSNQQGTAVQHRDPCWTLYGDLCGRRVWKRIDRCVYIMNHFAAHLTLIHMVSQLHNMLERGCSQG